MNQRQCYSTVTKKSSQEKEWGGTNAIMCQYGVTELLIRYSLPTHFRAERKQFGQANEVAVHNCNARSNGNIYPANVSHFHLFLAGHHDARQKFEHREGKHTQRNIVSIQVLDWVPQFSISCQ